MTDQITPPAIVRPAGAENVIAITAVTLQTMASVEQQREQIKLRKESVTNALDNDKVYSELKDQQKELVLKMKEEKLRVISENNLALYVAETKDMERELRDQQLTLFDHLDSYRKTTGQNSIEDENGNVYKLRAQYKITKRG